MPPARHIFCIHLLHWSIRRRCRRLRDAEIGAVAVLHTVRQRRMVKEASPLAQARGVRPGMTAAEAQALCAALRWVEHDADGDRRALDALGRWLTRFTPIVARGWDDGDDTPVLLMDLTGCERLFGGIDVLVRRIRQKMVQFNIVAQTALAPTPGAAWALAISQGAERGIRRPESGGRKGVANHAVGAPAAGAGDIIGTGTGDAAVAHAGDWPGVLARLPVETLRLERGAIEGLRHLGLRTVGDVMALPRDQLPARFGAGLLKRIDQLTGRLHEPLTHLVHEAPVTAQLTLETPVEDREVIAQIYQKLLETVSADLARRGHGARQLRLTCTPDRGWGRPVVVRTIALSQPVRHVPTLMPLVRCELEQVDGTHGFVRFQLDVPVHEPADERQVALFDRQQVEQQQAFARLMERLHVRLGNAAVVQPVLAESHLPERAWRAGAMAEAPAADAVTAPRPLVLFHQPIEVRVMCEPSDGRIGQPRQFACDGTVHRLEQVIGPERISGEWWRAHHHTRDYYEVEDHAGRRYWLFRVLYPRDDGDVSARWFLHGRFE